MLTVCNNNNSLRSQTNFFCPPPPKFLIRNHSSTWHLIPRRLETIKRLKWRTGEEICTLNVLKWTSGLRHWPSFSACRGADVWTCPPGREQCGCIVFINNRQSSQSPSPLPLSLLPLPPSHIVKLVFQIVFHDLGNGQLLQVLQALEADAVADFYSTQVLQRARLSWNKSRNID